MIYVAPLYPDRDNQAILIATTKYSVGKRDVKTVFNFIDFEIFNGFCPPQFINQDADPWVYAVYRRFNCSSFIDISIRNKIGGTIETGVEARYARAHLENWRNLEIEPAVQLISQPFLLLW